MPKTFYTDTGSFGVLNATASNAYTASLATTASYSSTASYVATASYSLTASYSSTASYVNLQAGPGIIITDTAITASVRTINGVAPTSNGNVTATITGTVTGTSASLVLSSSGNVTGSIPNALFWVVSGDPTSSNNGKTWIFNSGSVGQWLPVAPLDTAAGDARYLMLTPQSNLAGNLNLGGNNITNIGLMQGTASWAQSASNATNALTASYLPVGTYSITSSWAQTSSQATSASYALSASNAISSSYAKSGSYTVSSSYALSASYALTSSNAVSSSYGLSSSYALSASQAVSSSFSLTASYALNVGSSPGGLNTQIQYNNNGIFAGVPDLTYNGVTLIATGSFKGNVNGTSSWAQSSSQAVSSSYVVSASYALTSSYAVSSSKAVSSSYSNTSSYSTTSSYVATSSYSISSSYATTALNVINGSTPSAGGSNTQIQYNNSGFFGGASTFTFNSSTNTVSLTGSLILSGSATSSINSLVKVGKSYYVYNQNDLRTAVSDHANGLCKKIYVCNDIALTSSLILPLSTSITTGGYRDSLFIDLCGNKIYDSSSAGLSYLIGRKPTDQVTAKDSSSAWSLVLTNGTLEGKYDSNTHTIYTGTLLDLGATYNSLVEELNLRFATRGIWYKFCLMSTIRNCMSNNIKGIPFSLDIGDWSGADSSSANAQSNHSKIEQCRVDVLYNSTASFEVRGSSGTVLSQIISEGDSPIWHLMWDALGCSVVKDGTIDIFHIESTSISGGLYLKPRDGVININGLFCQYNNTPIIANASTNTTTYRLKNIDYIAGSTFSGSGTNGIWIYDGDYNGINFLDSTRWEGGSLPGTYMWNYYGGPTDDFTNGGKAVWRTYANASIGGGHAYTVEYGPTYTAILSGSFKSV